MMLQSESNTFTNLYNAVILLTNENKETPDDGNNSCKKYKTMSKDNIIMHAISDILRIQLKNVVLLS